MVQTPGNSSQTSMRAVLVDDDTSIRDLLRIIIVEKLGHEIVGEARTATQAIEVVSRTNPDYVTLDLRLPDRSGFGVVSECARRMPKPPMFLTFSGYCDACTTFYADRLHVNGYVHKGSCSMNVILDAIRAVTSGSAYYCEQFENEKRARLMDPLSFDKVLGNRERDVVVMVGKLCDDSEIAERLGITVSTVERHRGNILTKLEVPTRVGLQRYAVEHGLIFGEQELEPWQ